MKDKILRALKENTHGYVSGEALSELLGVSRTAVWKHMKVLMKEGYDIESSSKKGYRLIASLDMLNAHEIAYNLNTKVLASEIHYFPVIDSTNSYAKKIASEGCTDGTLVAADIQTAGRGRLGREWTSIGGKGIWMSIVLRPSIAPEDVQIITLAASVAVIRAIKAVTGIEAGIKWPNDIILDGKKVCGILTEMNSEMERVNFLILGIGINVNHEKDDFPVELKDSAVSLRIFAQEHSAQPVCEGLVIFNRNSIMQKVLFELEQIYSKINNSFISDITKEWKRYSVTLGRQVRIISKNNGYTGIARDITTDGKLLVECTDGIVREVLSGEVSVRGLLGYS